ncbi:unnamed protein product [Closterium sp. Naga37s-1]|nr:unnamed protein product [Closterium sp. Naga37s-1]
MSVWLSDEWLLRQLTPLHSIPPFPPLSPKVPCEVCGRVASESTLPPLLVPPFFTLAPLCPPEFHAECVDEWLSTKQPLCPICKGDAHAPSTSPPHTSSSSTAGTNIAAHPSVSTPPSLGQLSSSSSPISSKLETSSPSSRSSSPRTQFHPSTSSLLLTSLLPNLPWLRHPASSRASSSALAVPSPSAAKIGEGDIRRPFLLFPGPAASPSSPSHLVADSAPMHAELSHQTDLMSIG